MKTLKFYLKIMQCFNFGASLLEKLLFWFCICFVFVLPIFDKWPGHKQSNPPHILGLSEPRETTHFNSPWRSSNTTFLTAF